ncbi:MAG: stage V sporulation protein S [Candidatus Bipolaricaulota bacterium]|nr:stage V sporulation protein S [Candidatus Bipolaricaulota bacterium]
MEVLRVSSTSNPGATAGALANGIREAGVAEMQAIGPRAVNQAVKAIAIARGYLAASGVDLYFLPGFLSVRIDENEKTAIHFAIRTRHPIPGGDENTEAEGW